MKCAIYSLKNTNRQYSFDNQQRDNECRMGITLLHEDPSTQVPWTRTIFILLFVVFVVVVVAMLGVL
jgi:hypothetical protein